MVGSFVSLVRATDLTGRRMGVVSIGRELVINSPETGFTSLIFAVRQAVMMPMRSVACVHPGRFILVGEMLDPLSEHLGLTNVNTGASGRRGLLQKQSSRNQQGHGRSAGRFLH